VDRRKDRNKYLQKDTNTIMLEVLISIPYVKLYSSQYFSDNEILKEGKKGFGIDCCNF
jgi:hypothetical protein